MRKIAIIALLLTVCLVACGGGKNTVPNLTFEPIQEGASKIHLADFKGKVVMIDFWATWCGPCLESIPEVDRLYNTYNKQGLEIIAVSDETLQEVREFRKKLSISYPMYIDPTDASSIAFNIEAIPHAIIISKTGEIVFEGHPGDAAAFEKVIKEQLSK